MLHDFLLEENKRLMKPLIQPAGASYTGMVMMANYECFEHLAPRCHMLSIMPCLGFEALIIKQVIRIYS
jgi:hypothetical protein